MTTILPSSFGRVKTRRRKVPGLFLLLFAIFLIVVLTFWRQPVSALVVKLLTPLFYVREELAKSTVAELRSELASTTAKLADRDQLYAENQELKLLLGRSNTSRETLAAVLMRPPATPYDTLLIDIGSKQGVAVGQMVFAGGKSAVGDISEVFENSARVSLFSAPSRSFEALVQQASGKTLAVAFSGQGAGSFVGQVPAGSGVSVGDTVVVPGMQSAYLGEIAHIDAPDGSSFETLYVQLPVNVFMLRFVEVQTRL
jgi:cell shape-determining protein MreC